MKRISIKWLLPAILVVSIFAILCVNFYDKSEGEAADQQVTEAKTVKEDLQRDTADEDSAKITVGEKPQEDQLESVTFKPSRSSKIEPNQKLVIKKPQELRKVDEEIPSERISAPETDTEATLVVIDAEINKLADELIAAVLDGSDQEAIDVLDHLVAIGERSVPRLLDILTNEPNETVALYAAKGLATIGSPTATAELVIILSGTPDGSFKEELTREVSSIQNYQSWPVLLDSIVQTEDAAVLRAASSALATVADSEVVDEIVRLYDEIESETKNQGSSETPAETGIVMEGQLESQVEGEDTECTECDAKTENAQNRLASVIKNIQNLEAVEALKAYAGEIDSAPADPVEKAAIDALTKIGTPETVSYLLERLENAPPDQTSYVSNSVTQINNDNARLALMYAAGGNKEATLDQTRVSAIYALANYPNQQVRLLLTDLAADKLVDAETENASVDNAQNDTIVSIAAKKTLEKIDKMFSDNDDIANVVENSDECETCDQ